MYRIKDSNKEIEYAIAYNHEVSDAPILCVSQLTVTVCDSSATVVKDFELQLDAAKITAIVGESGSGKSLACLAMMQLLPNGLKRTSGIIKLDGSDISELPESRLRALRGKQIAYVFQDPSSCLNPVLSIHTQLDEVLLAHFQSMPSAERQRRSRQLLAEVGLGELQDIRSNYSHQLSGGQRQRLLLALSLAADPQVLIADEITTALDPETQEMIIGLLTELCAKRELAIVFITHDISLAKQIADNIVVMHASTVVECNSTGHIFTSPQHPVTKRLLAAAEKQRAVQIETKSQEVVLEAKRLTISYRVPRIFGRARLSEIVSDISFKLLRGQTLAIVGKSGSGKSTIARAVCGLAHEIKGELNLHIENDVIALHQKDQAALRPFRRHVSMIFQDPTSSLNPLMPIWKSVAEPLLVHSQSDAATRKQRALELLSEVGLDAALLSERLPSQLSGGQCQRVAIARALALNPEVVVCDEAISSLDLTAQNEIIDLLLQLQQRRLLSYLFISHDPELVERIAHDILSLNKLL
ncbi:MAG: oligopeptide transport system ATP-binding protein [Myxococcota bacterium]|jgi:oligopeptide transport system ATP-binding protein